MRTHFSVDFRLTNHKPRKLTAAGASFNQAILKCNVDHHNGMPNNYILLFNNDYILHFLNILVIVDYSATDNS